jgi:multidrug efflux pump subunit AcrA (membrane-fusion protein)
MQKRRFVTIAIVVVAAIVVSVCAISASQKSSAGASGSSTAGGMSGGKAGAGGPPGFGGETQSTVKAVRVKAAATETLRPYIDEGGDVEALVNVSVYPDIGGKLADLKVALGDSVAKGETIASVDPSKPGSSYAISAVPSPITGTVTSVIAERGETVTTSSAIAKVGVIDELKIVVNLPERDSAKVAKGMSAEVSLAALPGEKLKATVSRVSPVLDSESRTREVTLEFLAKNDRVAAGMYAESRIYIAPLVGRVVIPEAAVVTRDEENYVFTTADDVAKKTVVKLGTAVDGLVEVVSGLKAGDEVVVEGQDQLSDGKKVEITTGSSK